MVTPLLLAAAAVYAAYLVLAVVLIRRGSGTTSRDGLAILAYVGGVALLTIARNPLPMLPLQVGVAAVVALSLIPLAFVYRSDLARSPRKRVGA